MNLPVDDDPLVAIGGGRLVVSCTWGVATPGAWAGVRVRGVPDAPTAGRFSFRSELLEVDSHGQPLMLIERASHAGEIPMQGESSVFDTHLPASSPAFYCIFVSVGLDAFAAERRSYVTVLEGVTETSLIPRQIPVRAGDALPFSILAGLTSVSGGARYELERRVAPDEWVVCNAETVWPACAFKLRPGQRLDHVATIPRDAPSGRYRVRKSLAMVEPSATASLAFEFDVVP